MLTEFCQENTVIIANTLFQHQKRRFYTFKNISEDSTHGHHQMINPEIRLIILFAAKDGEALYSQPKQDRELTVGQIMNSFFAKFRLKLKKVGRITRLFRYDLNLIPYDKVFNGLDLVDRVLEEL